MSASYSGIFAEGKITASTAVSNAVSDGLMDSGIESRSETVRIATGTPNITSDCILANQASCEEVVTQEVATVFGNINNFVTVPSEQIGSVSLNEIVKGYFNDSIGLGEIFFQAVNETFGSIDPPDGDVYLIYYLGGFGCNQTLTAVQFKLELNKCTLIRQGPPTSIYVKVSIEGQSYKVTQASNKECFVNTADAGEKMFPFGVCYNGDKDPGLLLKNIYDVFTGTGIFIILLSLGGEDFTNPDDEFAVFLSDTVVSGVPFSPTDCTIFNPTIGRNVCGPSITSF